MLTELTTPARNGVYKLGYTDDDKIVPTEPGFYVLVTTFEGDDRVQAYQSSPADVLERFHVPPTGTEVPVSVITQATPEAAVGEPFSDTALVQGTTIPDGAYLVFRAYGPHPAEEGAVCESPFYVSDEIPVTQAGIYPSGTTTVSEPGNVFWVETLYGADGDVIAEGTCGAPGETTVITEQPDETTTVTEVPDEPGKPGVPGELAHTGADGDWWPIGLAGGLIAAATGGVLLFGRRLAIARERTGYVREEDEAFEEFKAQFEGAKEE